MEPHDEPPPPPLRRPKKVDTAVGVNPNDWTSFDVTKSLRMLRTGDEAAVARELRKLHLRWWHAQVKPMQTIFEHAGLPQRVIDEVSKVVKTC